MRPQPHVVLESLAQVYHLGNALPYDEDEAEESAERPMGKCDAVGARIYLATG